MQNNDRKKLSDKVTADLLRLIQEEGRFKPGEQLPNEIELAEQLGVSRTTLREAENVLVSRNILTKHRGRGTFVVDPGEKEAEAEFDNLNYMQSRLYDLYKLRLMMEPPMAGLAAVKATDEELDEIERIGKRIEDPALSNAQVMEYNRQFHMSIAKATHNDFIFRIFNNINTAIVRYFNVEDEEKINNEDMIRSHSMIIRYLKLRDEQGATEAMRIHLKYSIQDFNIEK